MKSSQNQNDRRRSSNVPIPFDKHNFLDRSEPPAPRPFIDRRPPTMKEEAQRYTYKQPEFIDVDRLFKRTRSEPAIYWNDVGEVEVAVRKAKRAALSSRKKSLA